VSAGQTAQIGRGPGPGQCERHPAGHSVSAPASVSATQTPATRAMRAAWEVWPPRTAGVSATRWSQC